VGAICLLLLGVCCLAAGAEEKAQKPEAPAGWERYKFLEQRNIFSRDQASGRGRKRETEVASEGTFLLDGIIQQDGQQTAFLRNTKTGVTKVVRAGDEIGGGKITSISATLDSLNFVREGAASEVKVGKTLDGSEAQASAAPARTGGPEEHVESDSAEGAAMERLRKKRQEELQK
jgi:hypothetical protein